MVLENDDGKMYDVFLRPETMRDIDPTEFADDAGAFIVPHAYSIVVAPESEDPDLRRGGKVIGSVSGWHLNGDGFFEQPLYKRYANALVEEADAIHQDLSNIARCFYLNGVFEGTELCSGMTLDLFYLSSVKVASAWRGFSLGLLAAEVMLRNHAVNTHIIVQPADQEAKLFAYWASLGLERFTEEGFTHLLFHNAEKKRQPLFEIPSPLRRATAFRGYRST